MTIKLLRYKINVSIIASIHIQPTDNDQSNPQEIDSLSPLSYTCDHNINNIEVIKPIDQELNVETVNDIKIDKHHIQLTYIVHNLLRISQSFKYNKTLPGISTSLQEPILQCDIFNCKDIDELTLDNVIVHNIIIEDQYSLIESKDHKQQYILDSISTIRDIQTQLSDIIKTGSNNDSIYHIQFRNFGDMNMQKYIDTCNYINPMTNTNHISDISICQEFGDFLSYVKDFLLDAHLWQISQDLPEDNTMDAIKSDQYIIKYQSNINRILLSLYKF